MRDAVTQGAPLNYNKNGAIFMAQSAELTHIIDKILHAYHMKINGALHS